MSGGEWKVATWLCGGCGIATSQRFHVPTDGDPADADPPDPWTVTVQDDGSPLVLCPDCAKARATGEAMALDRLASYEGMPRDQAEAAWASAHLCLRCAHAVLCRFAPDETGAELLVTVAACAAFAPEPE